MWLSRMLGHQATAFETGSGILTVTPWTCAESQDANGADLGSDSSERPRDQICGPQA